MKHVPMLEKEPEALAEWRAKHPEDTATMAGHAAVAWERFRSSGAYRPLVDLLMKRQQGLCGYCEQQLHDDGQLVVNDYQVEHVMAKSGGSERVIDWRNLMLCCSGGTWSYHKDPTRHRRSSRKESNISCGQAKGNADVEGPCDPRAFPWREPVVTISVDGRMSPNEGACHRAGIDPDALRRVIDDDLALNCERLRIAREKVIDNIQREQKELFEWLFAASHLTQDERKQAFQLLVKGRLCPNRFGHLRRFWTTERLYLGEDAEAWISANAALLHFDG